MGINPDPVSLKGNPRFHEMLSTRMVPTAAGANARLSVFVPGATVEESNAIVLDMSSRQAREFAHKLLRVADLTEEAHEDFWAGSR